MDYFTMRHRKTQRRVFYTCVVLFSMALIAIPIVLSIVNPNVRLPDIHGGPPAELMRDYNRAVSQMRRERSRTADFYAMLDLLTVNYPFLEAAAEATGVNYAALAQEAAEELEEVAATEVASSFLMDFINERFLSFFAGLGSPHVTPLSGIEWLAQPYFFGHHDWRFYDDRFDIPVRDNNIAAEIWEDGIAYLRIHTFLPKGYEPISHNPFWYFDTETEAARLLDIFASLDGVEDLLIDIRGIGSGFGDYFWPYIVAPNVRAPVEGRFNAFHMDAHFAQRVSEAYRLWYRFGGVHNAFTLAREFAHPLPAHITLGFPIHIAAQPAGEAAFGGQIWLLADSDNFSGPNFMYLQLAQQAGLRILYQENPESAGWALSYARLPVSGLALRFNPLYFTDHEGMALEVQGIQADAHLASGPGDGLDQARDVILQRRPL